MLAVTVNAQASLYNISEEWLINAKQASSYELDTTELNTAIAELPDDVSLEELYRLCQSSLAEYFFEYAKNKGIHQQEEWLSISGWYSPIAANLFLKPKNLDVRAYANEKGMKSPSYDFSTMAAEYFLPLNGSLENSIKCRTPRKYHYVKALFPAVDSPLEPYSCDTIDSGMLRDINFIDPISQGAINMGKINADTVVGFELLYATPGTADVAEIAGHLLLRIKLNNSAHKKGGYENPHDLVISFLADTDNKQQNLSVEAKKPVKQCEKSWFNLVEEDEGFEAFSAISQSLKGLSGGFLTTMERQTLNEVIKNYTVEEDRNLLRYELLLNEQQKTSLLERLYIAQKNYSTPYYFFDQNCASVLVDIIAQGIGNEKIATFNPAIVPPNTLVGLFINEGLAKPVYPSFYSYRKKGQIAQEAIRIKYLFLSEKYQALNWPAISAVFDSDDKARLGFIKQLKRLNEDYLADIKTLPSELYAFFLLLQEAELVYQEKSKDCDNYSSLSSAAIRQVQKDMLRDPRLNIYPEYYDMQEQVYKPYGEIERQHFKQGNTYSELFALEASLGASKTSMNSWQPILTAGVVLVKQDMGSRSNVAMQRGNHLRLGRLNINVNLDSQKIDQWHLTGLELRKLKTRLGSVPSVLSKHGSVGLGLSVADIYHNEVLDWRQSAVIGGETIFNVFSSDNNDSYWFFSAGVDGTVQTLQDESAYALTLPLRTEFLWSIDEHDRWQLRGEYEYNWSGFDEVFSSEYVSSKLSYLWAGVESRTVEAWFKVDYRSLNNHALSTVQSSIGFNLYIW